MAVYLIFIFIYILAAYITGVARLFLLWAKYEYYYSSRATQFEYTDFVITISRKQKIFSHFFSNLSFLDAFRCLLGEILNSNKRSTGRKNKLKGRMRPAGLSLAMSALLVQITNNSSLTKHNLTRPNF